MMTHARRRRPAVCALLAVCLAAGPAGLAVTLVGHYDVNNPASWTGTQLLNLVAPASNILTPDDGSPRVQSGPNTVAADFGAPVYRGSGAATTVPPPPGQGALNRAWIDFPKYGVLAGSNLDQKPLFHTGLAGNANIGGYTLEGFFLMRTGYSATENTGIGFGQDTNGENQLIRVPRGTNTNLYSNSCVDNAVGDPQSLEQVDQNINTIIPREVWFHFVKVHDPALDQIRFYINGVPQPALTTTLDADNTALEYHAFGLNYGSAGQAGREIRGIGYSMTRFYRGAMTDAEILASFQQVAFPEPTSAVLLLLALPLLRRRR